LTKLKPDLKCFDSYSPVFLQIEKMKSKKIFVFFIVLVVLLSCNNRKDYINLKGNALGTSFNIKYKGNKTYTKEIDSLFQVVNTALSTYHSNSIISRINKGDTAVLTNNHFNTVFNKAKIIHKQTNGFFDPTVGNLVNAWGFGPKHLKIEMDSSTVNTMMALVGFEKLSLINNHVYKTHPDIFIDFNAIAKGYAVDVMGRFLESKGVSDYMVEIGGELRVRGSNSREAPWLIAIEKPLTDGTRAIETTVELSDKSMATSGNYRKFKIDENGRKFVHTINPKTGFTEQNDLLSVSVITESDCADADAYATAFMAMGYNKAKVFLEKHSEIKAVLIYIDKNGEIRLEKQQI